MNANNIGIVARVNFSDEATAKDFPGMAVVKASPEMGFLVWLNGYGGMYSRSVTVSKRLGDIAISETFKTVGNLNGFVVDRLADEKAYASAAEGLTGKEFEKFHCQIEEQLMDQLVYEPIREACRRIGVTKLWKHHGQPIRDCSDLVVSDLIEKGPITVDVQC